MTYVVSITSIQNGTEKIYLEYALIFLNFCIQYLDYTAKLDYIFIWLEYGDTCNLTTFFE